MHDDDAALDLLLGKLEGVRKQGGYWMARCPGHDDRKASLSIKRGTEQPVIFKCHAGCERDTILDALGITLADVSKPHEESREIWTPAGPALAVYDYTDEHGTLLFQVCRTLGKQFPQRRPDSSGGWRWKLGDVRRVPYRLPKILDAIRDGKTVYIVEGEKDVHAIEAAGGIATTSPGGAGKWREEYDAYFTGASVVVVADRDEPGQYHAEDIARHLRPIAKAVLLTKAAEGKDAADHLAAGHSLAELVQQRDGILAVIDLEPATRVVPSPSLTCSDMLYLGAVHTLSGPPDCGKTTLACWWMLEAIRSGGTVLFLDEEGGEEIVTEKFQALDAKPGERIAYVPFPSRMWGPGDVAELDHLMSERRPALVAWDSSAAFLARAGLDENSAADVTRFYATILARCARQHGAAVVVIDHDTKNGEPSRYARGSGAKLAATDVAYKITQVRAFSKTQNGVSKLTVTKDRRGWLHRNHEIAFTTDPHLALAIREADADDGPVAGMAPAAQKILAVLDDQAVGWREINDRLLPKFGHRLQRETISRHLNELLRDGLVTRTGFSTSLWKLPDDQTTL